MVTRCVIFVSATVEFDIPTNLLRGFNRFESDLVLRFLVNLRRILCVFPFPRFKIVSRYWGTTEDTVSRLHVSDPYSNNTFCKTSVFLYSLPHGFLEIYSELSFL